MAISDSDDVMLTTIDNPYNPFTQFDEWLLYDMQKGYNTINYLARVCPTSDSLSQADEDAAIEYAIDEICRLNILGIYRKVTMKTFNQLKQNQN